MKQTIADRLAQALKESHFTSQMELAKAAGTSKGNISQWLTPNMVKPENVKADVLERICQALGIRPRWLLYGEAPVREPPRRARNTQDEADLQGLYNRASPATKAAVDLLLLPKAERDALLRKQPTKAVAALIEALEEGAAAALKIKSAA